MNYYPVNLDLRRKKCVVVGGGKVAERKTSGLIECSADVTVISPALTPKLQELSNRKKINHISRSYEPGDLEGAYLAIASTDNRRVNRNVAEEAKKLGIPVNVVSSPKLSDFTVPGILRRGSLMVTVSTSGNSPALSRRLRVELENIFGKEYEIFTELLGAVRKKFRAASPQRRRHIYTGVAESKIPELLKSEKYREAEEELKKITGLGFDDIGFSLKS